MCWLVGHGIAAEESWSLFVVAVHACPKKDIFGHASCVSMGRPPVYARHARNGLGSARPDDLVFNGI